MFFLIKKMLEIARWYAPHALPVFTASSVSEITMSTIVISHCSDIPHQFFILFLSFSTFWALEQLYL